MKKNIAIIAGGDSGEFQISVNSAAVVLKHLDKEKYHSYTVIVKGQVWEYLDEDGRKYPIDKEDFSLHILEEHITFDLVFNIIHGTPGENGKIQAYFDLIGMPYTGCGLSCSSLTFNKSYCNKVVNAYGIHTANSVHLFKGQIYSVDEVKKTLNFPVFVKPNNGGSSVATTRVNEESELSKAVDIAFEEDDEVLVEEFIAGREISCGAFQFENELLIFPLTEIISKKEFFDYEAKYTEGMAEEITPADVQPHIEVEVKAISAELYHRLNCKGVVRFDYIFNEEAVYFLEVNTVPGMSEASIIPNQAEEMGITIGRLFEMMIEDAE